MRPITLSLIGPTALGRIAVEPHHMLVGGPRFGGETASNGQGGQRAVICVQAIAVQSAFRQ